MWLRVGSCDRSGGVLLLFGHIRVHSGAGSPVLHHIWVVLPLCRTEGQVSRTTRDVVAVSSASQCGGVERDSAVCTDGFGCAGVHHLSHAAGERFSQRCLSALLL